MAYSILVLGIIAIIGGIIIALKHSDTKMHFKLVIIGFVITIISILLLFLHQMGSTKVKNAFQQYNIKYMQMAVKNAFDQVEIKSIASYFTLPPQKFLVFGGGVNHSVWTEKVVVGNVNKQDFNCGTMIERIVYEQKTGKITTTKKTYNRYLYFTCTINSQDIVTTIKPETLGSRIMGSNRGDQLESAEFEKLFALDYSDPIKLRKLLVPKVMSKMIDLAATQKPLPHIFVNEKQVTIMYPYMNISSPTSSTVNLVNLVIKDSSEEELLRDVIGMLNFTLTIFLASYSWVASLELNEKVVVKN